MEESSCEIISGSGGVGTRSSDSAYVVTLAPLLHVRTVLTDFHYGDVALLSDHLYGFFGIEMGISERLILVGKNDIYILFHQIFEEGMVLIDDVIRCQIQRHHTSGFFRKTDCFLKQFMVLNQITLYMEDIIAGKGIFLYVICAQLCCSAQVSSKRALTIRRHQDDRKTGHRGLREQKNGFDTVLDHVLTVEIPDFIISDLTDKSRFAAQRSDTVDRVRGRTACNHTFSYRKKTILDLLSLFS